jgi:hypothetical protein
LEWEGQLNQCIAGAAVTTDVSVTWHDRVGSIGYQVSAKNGRAVGSLPACGRSAALIRSRLLFGHSSFVCVSLCQREWNHADSQQ